MARFDRLTVLNTMLADGLISVFYHPDINIAVEVADGIVKGGAQLLEFTNRGDQAIEVFTKLEYAARSKFPGLMLGVGSIVDAASAAAYINVGASFVVGPVLNAE